MWLLHSTKHYEIMWQGMNTQCIFRARLYHFTKLASLYIQLYDAYAVAIFLLFAHGFHSTTYVDTYNLLSSSEMKRALWVPRHLSTVLLTTCPLPILAALLRGQSPNFKYSVAHYYKSHGSMQ